MLGFLFRHHGSHLGVLAWLVVWNMNFMTFHSVGNFIIPTDELIFFRGVGIPPTRVGLYLIGLSWRLVCPKRTFWLSNVGKRLLCLCLGIPILGHVNGNNVWYLGVPNFEIHMSRESRAPTDWDILKWHWNRPANFGGCAWSYFSRTTHAQFKKQKRQVGRWSQGVILLTYWNNHNSPRVPGIVTGAADKKAQTSLQMHWLFHDVARPRGAKTDGSRQDPETVGVTWSVVRWN